MKRVRLKKFGSHVMNKVSRSMFPVEEKLIELPEIPDHNDNFCHENIDTVKDEYSNTFLYTEYLKRKFFIDCKYKKAGEDFIYGKDRKKSYIPKSYTTPEECLNDIYNIFLTESERVPFTINKERTKNLYKILEDNNFDIYSIIKALFQNNLNIIKDILSNPSNYHCCISNDDIEYIKSQSLKVDDYLCERCLYFYITRDIFIKYNSSNFINISNIICRCWPYFDFEFLVIYKNIIDKYSLYMTDIFNLTNIGDIINNNYQLPTLSRYFFLPHEPEDKFSNERSIDINTDFINNRLNISLDLINNFDTISLAKFIYESIVCALYNYKNITGKNYSIHEVSYFITNIDFIDSRTMDSEDKINGLFIWDRVYRENYTGDISTIIKSFYNKYLMKKTNEPFGEKNERLLRRHYIATRKGIEVLQLIPIKS